MSASEESSSTSRGAGDDAESADWDTEDVSHPLHNDERGEVGGDYASHNVYDSLPSTGTMSATESVKIVEKKKYFDEDDEKIDVGSGELASFQRDVLKARKKAEKAAKKDKEKAKGKGIDSPSAAVGEAAVPEEKAIVSLATHKKIEIENRRRDLIAVRHESQPPQTNSNPLSGANKPSAEDDTPIATTFRCVVPDNVCGYNYDSVVQFGFVCIIFRIEGEPERVVEMDRVGNGLYTAKVSMRAGLYEQAPKRCFSYYYAVYPHEKRRGESRKVEDGNYRPVRGYTEEVWDIYMYHRYRTYGHGPRQEEAKDAFGQFMNELITGSGEAREGGAVAVLKDMRAEQVYGLLERYAVMHASLREEDSATRNSVWEWVEKEAEQCKALPPHLLLVLCAIYGSSQGFAVRAKETSSYSMGYGYGGYGYSTYGGSSQKNKPKEKSGGGGWWPFGGSGSGESRTAKHASTILRALMNVSDWSAEGSLIVRIFGRQTFQWAVRGLRELCMEDLQLNKSYQWVRLLPLLDMLSEMHRVYAVPCTSVRPVLRKARDMADAFMNAVVEMERDGLLFAPSDYSYQLLPVVSVMMEQAPTMACVGALMQSHDGILLTRAEYYAVFVVELREKVRTFQFAKKAKKQTGDLRALLHILRCLQVYDVGRTVQALLENRRASECVSPTRLMPLVEYFASAEGCDAEGDLKNDVGTALQGYLVRAYMSNEGRVLSHLLAHMVKTWNQLFSSASLSAFERQLQGSLSQLLSGCSDSAVLLEELPAMVGDDFHAQVYELFRTRARKAVAAFSSGKKQQLQLFDTLLKLGERDPSGPAYSLKCELLLSLLHGAAGHAPELPSILESAELLKKFFKNYYKSGQALKGMLVPVGEYLDVTKSVLQVARSK